MTFAGENMVQKFEFNKKRIQNLFEVMMKNRDIEVRCDSRAFKGRKCDKIVCVEKKLLFLE